MAERGHAWLGWSCLLLVAACTASEDPVSATLSVAGGSLVHPSGFELVVPAGALDEPMPITIAVDDAQTDAAYENLGRRFVVSAPTTVRLHFPVLVRATFDAPPDDAPVSVMFLPNDETDWAQLPTTTDAGARVASARSLELGSFEVVGRTGLPDLAPRAESTLPVQTVGAAMSPVPIEIPGEPGDATLVIQGAEVPVGLHLLGPSFGGNFSLEGHFAFWLDVTSNGRRARAPFTIDVGPASDSTATIRSANPSSVSPFEPEPVLVTLTGSAFSPRSAVLLGEPPVLLPSRYLGPEKMLVLIPQRVRAQFSGATPLRVMNGEQPSNTLPILVGGGDVVAVPPVITSVQPTQITAGSGDTVIVVSGANFANDAVVLANEVSLALNSRAPSMLQAVAPASLLASPGRLTIQVKNPTTAPPQTSAAFAVDVVSGTEPPDGGTPDAGTPDAGSPDAGTPDGGAPDAGFTDNPVPAVRAIQPASAAQWSAPSTHWLSGSGFVPSSVAYLDDGTALKTDYVSSAELTVTVPETAKFVAGRVGVYVRNPFPGGGQGTGQTLEITAAPAPSPIAYSVTPDKVAQGAGDVVVTIAGAFFDAGAQVVFDGNVLTTVSDGPRQLRALLPAGAHGTAGAHSVLVRNPAPAQPTDSKPLTLTVTQFPQPYVTGLGETSMFVPPGSPDTHVHVVGGNFEFGAVVSYLGHDLPTGYVTDRELWTVLPAQLALTEQTQALTVRNPANAGGLTSNPAKLFVSNPPPIIRSIFPEQVAAGGADLTVEVQFESGEEPQPGVTATANNVPVAIARGAQREWRITVPAAQLAQPGTVALRFSNPAPGGGFGNPFLLGVRASTRRPFITGVSPASVPRGTAGPVEITLNGSGFREGSRVYWSGRTVATTYVSEQQLKFSLSAQDLAAAGDRPFSLVVPDGGEAPSVFVVGGQNPVPTLTSAAPSAVVASNFATAITLKGTNFLPGATTATVRSGATTLSLGACFGDATSCPVTIPAEIMRLGGSFAVWVSNPTYGGGSSNELTVPIANAPPPLVLGTVARLEHLRRGAGTQTFGITGTGFSSNTVVTYAGNTLVSDASSPGILRITVPEQVLPAQGDFTVYVSTSGASGTFGMSVPVYDVPRIDSFSPQSYQRGSGTQHLVFNGSFPPADMAGYLVFFGQTRIFTAQSASATALSLDVGASAFTKPDLVELSVGIEGQARSNRVVQVVQ